MKKTILCAFMAIALTGCVDPLSDLDSNTRLTAAEMSYIQAAEAGGYDRGAIDGQNYEQYRKVWWNLADGANKKRSDPKYDEARVQPFCDLIEEIKVADYRIVTQFKKAPTLAYTFKEITGKTLEESCGLASPAIPVARTVDTGRSEGPELAPETYGLMIDAAKTCERARISLMSYPAGYVFTKTDYNKIMNLVNDCKRFELESTINSK